MCETREQTSESVYMCELMRACKFVCVQETGREKERNRVHVCVCDLMLPSLLHHPRQEDRLSFCRSIYLSRYGVASVSRID